MQILLDIPREFVEDFHKDRFTDCFMRLKSDTEDRLDSHNILLAGNYEIETLDMLRKAFQHSVVVDDGGLEVRKALNAYILQAMR